MSDDFRLEQRLQDFYDRVPDVEDALPFKDYLLKHEDSRMAWYLLGKQYAAKGQEAKANYCFAQAGEIYEAFESKPAPATAAGSLSLWRPSTTRRGWRASAAVLLLMAALLIPTLIAEAPGHQAHHVQEDQMPPSAAQSTGVIAAAIEPGQDGAAVLGKLLTRSNKRVPQVLVEAVMLDGWVDWQASGKPVASVISGSSPGTAVVTWYDPHWCGCEPGTPGNLPAAVRHWKPIQEQKLLLVSAVARYRQKFGKMPKTPKELTGNYPSNHMAGWTQAMSGWLAEQSDSQGVAGQETPVWPARSGEGRAIPAGAWHTLTEQPLEIVVDTVHHRLAVVSGRVLLRNYRVGLGGTRTPLGTFEISEKVRNPNGTAKGPFGSRGMTLSGTRYAIHGTDEPDSIGKDDSLGCIRMNAADVEELYDLVPMGTKVTIAKGGLPSATRVPPERFRLPHSHDETNPRKKYDWLN